MVKTRRIIVIAWFLAVFSICVNAQDIPNYLFLEVVDSADKPVAGATVILGNSLGTVLERPHFDGASKLTGSDGNVRFDLALFTSTYSDSIFKISKTGYFDFFDLGILIRRRDQTRAKIQLLKVSDSEKEKSLNNEQMKREFFWAAKRGESEKIRDSLKKGLSANLSTEDLRGVSEPKGVPVVLFAATSGDSETVKVLLKAGATVRSKNEPLRSILGYYLAASPSLKGKNETSSGRKKAIGKYQKVLSGLIKAGAATHDLFGLRMNALMFAAKQNDAESVKLLIKLGIPVNENIRGYTALIYAVDQYGHNYPGYSPIRVAEVLLKAGADPNIAANPLSEANCYSVLMQAVFGGDLELVKLLIKHGANVNFTCKNGDSPLRWARRHSAVSDKNQQEMIKILEAAGAK